MKYRKIDKCLIQYHPIYILLIDIGIIKEHIFKFGNSFIRIRRGLSQLRK